MRFKFFFGVLLLTLYGCPDPVGIDEPGTFTVVRGSVIDESGNRVPFGQVYAITDANFAGDFDDVPLYPVGEDGRFEIGFFNEFEEFSVTVGRIPDENFGCSATDVRLDKENEINLIVPRRLPVGVLLLRHAAGAPPARVKAAVDDRDISCPDDELIAAVAVADDTLIRYRTPLLLDFTERIEFRAFRNDTVYKEAFQYQTTGDSVYFEMNIE